MKLGFIGFGNMSGAIVEQVIDSGFINKKDIFVYDRDFVFASEKASAVGVNVSKSVDKLVDAVD